MALLRFLAGSGCAALALLLASLTARAQTAIPSPPPHAPSMDDALAAIRAYAPQAMADQGTPGLAVAITDRKRTLAIVTLGYANVDAKVPVSPSTQFAIGSITKSMTALALLQLVDAGKIDLNSPVQRYLPWFSIDSNGKRILVHELLSHTGGIPDDYAEEVGYGYDLVALRAAKTLFAPGTSWSYSNDGYGAVGAILASASGVPWMKAIVLRVFGPLNMSDSVAYFTPETLAKAAVGYQFRDNDRPPSLHPALAADAPFDFVDPAGSVLSTPEDMARYMRFYLNGGRTEYGSQLISAATFAAMTHADRLADGKPAGSDAPELPEAPEFYRQYGFGLSIFDDDGDHLIGHTGGVAGYTACMQMNLTRGFGAIAFANLVEAPLHPCAIVLYAMKVLRAQSAGEALPTPPPSPDPSRVDRARDYAGRYSGANGSMLQVVANGGRLQLIGGARTSTLYPRGDDLFWSDDPHYAMFLIAFHRDKSKQVVELTYGSQWFTNERYRGPRTFDYPASWDALVGRYENTYGDDPWITRVLVVQNRLTLDGVEPLKPLPDGSFAAGDSILHFDAYAGKIPQRLRIDGSSLYRVELP
jgi:D-alanyl-D-alanine carboxypeptidase